MPEKDSQNSSKAPPPSPKAPSAVPRARSPRAEKQSDASVAMSEECVDAISKLDAIRNSTLMIEFDLDGVILDANADFCRAMGYTPGEIIGRKHSLFVDEVYARSSEYQDFWRNLRRGLPFTDNVCRVTRDGQRVWLLATYAPVLDDAKTPIKIIKTAVDITEQTLRGVDSESKMSAIDKSQAIIEFDLDGNILDANENFVTAIGYSLSEIKGKHHSLFVDAETVSSREYQEFWDSLRRGEFRSGDYRRLGKGGREVWIRGCYTPVPGPDGKPIKVIKIASDVTETVRLRQESDTRREEMERIAEEVIAAANEFADGARIIAESSATLSAGAQSQAASVEQMTANVDELGKSIRLVSANTTETSHQAKATSEMATDGGRAVAEALDAMRMIEKSSEQISEIIQVIGEIASQTNLLALNAAIEAARAGQHGLGFAVVAEEVRKLAERSSEAAKEITGLIRESSRRVHEGSELSQKAGKALSEIVDAVSTSAAAMEQISDSTDAQASSASEVQAAIKVISDTTESNAASSEELAASAEELTAQANSLQQLVSRFQA
ncbi:MAG: PAS domain-containing methyl-accepting chemotaxis protein [Planctomycetota bacterium]